MKLSIHTAKTLANLGHVFSSSDKVISELIQNARRAGSKYVSFTTSGENESAQVVIRDGGAGIKDFSSLFTLSESRWSEHTEANDQPFGMGFFSVFYACKRVIVQSQGARIEIDTADALALKEFGDVRPDDEVKTGTAITLQGVNFRNVGETLKTLARTSSINVIFNGEALKRDLSFSELSAAHEVVETPFGKLVLVEPFSMHFTVVAQDLVVFRSHYNASKNMLFADTRVVKVRMPDRDGLINSAEFEKAFTEYLRRFFTERFASIRQEMSNDKAFVTRYFSKILTICPDMLNTIPYLPQDAFKDFPMPSLDSLHTAYRCDEMIIAKGDDVVVVDHDYDLRDGFCSVIGTYLFHTEAVMLKNGLPRDHWINDMVKTFRIDDFKVTVVNPESFEYDCGNFMYGGRALACDNIIITHKPSNRSVLAYENDTQNFNGFGVSWEEMLEDEALSSIYDEDGKQIDFKDYSMALLRQAADADVTSVLQQVQSYTNEWNDVEEDQLDEDAEIIKVALRTACGDDVATILSKLMGEIPAEVAKRVAGKIGSVKFVDRKVVFELN